MRLTAPANWEAQRPTAAGDDQPGWTKVKVAEGGVPVTKPLHWIGLRIHNKTAASITAGIDRFLFNSAPARNALTIRSPELLGRSNGQPFQEFTLANGPLHAPTGTSAALVVEVGQGTPPTWEEWKVVDDLPAGPHHVCRVNPVTGVIMFGNFDDKTRRKRGTAQFHPTVPKFAPAHTVMWPAEHREMLLPNSISALGTTLQGAMPAGISAVTNLGPAFDGSDEEPIDETLRRAPDVLKTRDRAVTAEDYENLARAATTDVVTVRCLTPRLNADGSAWNYAGMTRAPGSVYVIVVPDKGPSEARPEPTPNLISEVKEYLDRRRDLTASLIVVGPRYLPVKVTAQLNVWKQAINAGIDQTQVKSDTETRINAYLHPTRGGPDGTGWQAGQPVFASDLFRAIMPPENVAYIGSLALSADIPALSLPSVQSRRHRRQLGCSQGTPIRLDGERGLSARRRLRNRLRRKDTRHHDPPNRLKDVLWSTPASSYLRYLPPVLWESPPPEDRPTDATGFGLGTFLLAFEKTPYRSRRRRRHTARERGARTHA